MEISKSIYEGVVESSYQKKTTWADATCFGISSKIRWGAEPSRSYSKISGCTGNQKQRCVDHPRKI